MAGMEQIRIPRPGARLRQVPWESLPLGCVVLQWPRVHGSGLPELEGYPVMTASLRSRLWERCLFMRGRSVAIADPDALADLGDPPAFFREAFPRARDFLSACRELGCQRELARDAALRGEGAGAALGSTLAFEQTSYTLVKDWMASVGRILKDPARGASLLPGATVAGSDGTDRELGALVGDMLAGRIRILPREDVIVDICLDVSWSMACTGKADWFLGEFALFLAPLVMRLPLATWRIMLAGGEARYLDWDRMPRSANGIVELPRVKDLLHRMGVESGETDFAPFLRLVLKSQDTLADRGGRHLCILVTDGDCRDRDLSLRLLEKLPARGVDYLQLVIHHEDDWAEGVEVRAGLDGRDNIVDEADIRPEDKVIRRSPDELRAMGERRLRDVTDLAEAARGGQLVLTWDPLFRLVCIDVWQRWMAKVLAG